MKKTRYCLLLSLTFIILLGSFSCDRQEAKDRRHIIANPLNLNYRFQFDTLSQREAADPVLEYFKGKYYLFASKSGGYWSSMDLCEWKFIPCKSITTIEGYAPTILDYNDELYYLGSGGDPQIFKTANPDEDDWELIDTKFDIGMTDPAFFKDDNGDVYLYWGCSDVDPIMGAKVDPDNGFKVIGEPVVLIEHNDDKYGWEVPGVNNEEERVGWNEGPCVIKYKGNYYLQYAAPGTQYRVYADGTYISESPLGPYTYVESNPFSFKPGGFIGGAGHGHTFKDKYGNYWHVATMTISVRHMFERRIGLFPSYMDSNDEFHSHTLFTDYPFYVPQEKVDMENVNLSMGWHLISYDKECRASSFIAGYEPKNGVDERVETWWAADATDTDEWFEINLGKEMTLEAIQVNFADHEFKLIGPDTYVYNYIVEASNDGESWDVVVDRVNNEKDMPHELIVLDKPITATYVKITNKKKTPGSFSLYDLRLFGNGNGVKPASVQNIVAKRDSQDGRIITVEWDESPDAQGYILRWGVDKDQLHNETALYTNSFEGRFFNRDSKYYFTLEAFNDSGVSAKSTVFQTK